MKPVFPCKLGDFRFSVFLIQGPDALQLVLIDGTVTLCAGVYSQAAPDKLCENLHVAART